MIKLNRILSAVFLVIPAVAVAGNNFNALSTLNQSQFAKLSENLAAATSYKAVAPAEPLGSLGFDIGLGVSSTEIDSEVFDLASQGGWDLESLPVPKLQVQKGLPLNFDVGAFFTSVPQTDVKVWGGEIRYAIVPGGVLVPAFAVRATYSSLEGVDEINLHNTGFELTVSKGFAMLTPYAGVGRIYSSSEAVDVNSLKTEELELNKLYAGLNINLGMNLVLEVDQTGDYVTYSGRVGIRF